MRSISARLSSDALDAFSAIAVGQLLQNFRVIIFTVVDKRIESSLLRTPVPETGGIGNGLAKCLMKDEQARNLVEVARVLFKLTRFLIELLRVVGILLTRTEFCSFQLENPWIPLFTYFTIHLINSIKFFSRAHRKLKRSWLRTKTTRMSRIRH